MTPTWTRTFKVAVPLERLWQAFRDDAEYGRLLAWPDAGPEQTADPRRKKVVESKPMQWLKFVQDMDEISERAEFAIAFEATKSGSQFTVTRSSMAMSETAQVFAESNFLGYCHGFMDLVFYLETGIATRRHYQGCSLSCTGMLYREHDWGIEVREVKPDSFAEQAGLKPGDRLISMAGVPIYTRNDIWALVTEHAPDTEITVDYARGRERLQGTGCLSDKALAAWGE